LHELDELRLQAYENSKLYKAQTKAYHDKKLRVRKEYKARDKVLLYNSKYKFKALNLRSKWYGPFIVKHGYPSGYVKLYDKHGGSFIVNGHRVKLHHDEEQLNERTIEEIHLMCEERRMKAIPFMAPFSANYHETGKGIVIENILYVPREGSLLEKKLKKHPSPADHSLKNEALLGRQPVQIQENKKRRDEHAEIISSTKNLVSGSSAEASQRRKKSIYSSFQDLRLSCNEDMVKYKGQWPSTTRARALNEKSNKKIPPATS
ncbi:hypothetical protein Tco_0730987, partial [Tanacetum coccineum]